MAFFNDCEVLIMGAGIAGLAATRHLVQSGKKDVLLLEASDRLGGRIHTIYFGIPPTNIVELGANWIRGGCPKNPIYTLATQSARLPVEPATPQVKGLFYTPEGFMVDRDIASRAFDAFSQISVEMLDRGFGGEPGNTLDDFLQSRIDEELAAFEPDTRPLVSAVFNCLKNYLCFSNVGELPHLVSKKGFCKYQVMPGGDMKLPHGYGEIVDVIASTIPRSLFRFQARVSRIEWENCTEPKGKIIVRTDDDDVYRCRFIIITASVGHLKHNQHSLFDPPLPAKKQSAIERIGFGRVDKIFLLYESPFWDDNDMSFRFAWNHDQKLSKPWYEYIFCLEPVSNNPNVLVAWVFGPGAEEMEELTVPEVADRLTHLLQHFTGNKEIPRPKGIVRSCWVTNPFFCGSFSYVAAGNDGSEMETISEPLPSLNQPHLLFAGEATHPHYFSTVHGAMLSGIREAERIRRYLY